jgi:hypothetical protein
MVAVHPVYVAEQDPKALDLRHKPAGGLDFGVLGVVVALPNLHAAGQAAVADHSHNPLALLLFQLSMLFEDAEQLGAVQYGVFLQQLPAVVQEVLGFMENPIQRFRLLCRAVSESGLGAFY